MKRTALLKIGVPAIAVAAWALASMGRLVGEGGAEIGRAPRGGSNRTGFDPTDPAVISAGLANRNTVAAYRAIVSCLSKDASGAPTTVNLMTDQFPATTGFASEGGGNAKIEAFLNLPSPCIAPIMFVTSPGGAWFAATGQ
ncbi:MAG: hypothetical protein ACM3S5_01880 [Rhodospirillales bacterium]